MKRRRRGHTLIELLVVMAILTVATALMLGIYRSSITAFNHSSASIAMQTKTREALKRLGPLIVSGITTAGSASAVIYPAQTNVPKTSLVFTTTEDYLSPPDASIPNRCALWTSIPNPIPSFTYCIGVDPGGSTSLVLAKVSGTITGDPTGGSFVPAGLTVVGNPRALLRGESTRELGVFLKDPRFTRLTLNALQVKLSVETRDYQKATVDPITNQKVPKMLSYTAESLIQMPAVNP